MRKLCLNLYFWIMLVAVTILALLLFPFFLLVEGVFFKRSFPSAIRWGITCYGWVMVRAVPFFAPVKVEYTAGKHPLPAIFVANHSSAIDPYLLGALRVEAVCMTTWPLKIPVYSFFMRIAGYIDANEGWEKVYAQSEAVLHSGSSIFIWPEGHRSRDGELGRFKNGAFYLAVKTGTPLQPFCVIGAGRCLPPGKHLLSPSRVEMLVLDPVYPDMANDPEEEVFRLRNAVREAIKEALQRRDERELPAGSRTTGVERGVTC